MRLSGPVNSCHSPVLSLNAHEYGTLSRYSKGGDLRTRQLTFLISANLDDDQLRSMLDNVWFSVNQLLKQDPILNRSLASMDEFNKNIYNRGEDSVFSLLRDTAEDARTSGFATRWAPLFLDGTSISFSLKCSGHFPYLDVFYSALEHRMPYAAESSYMVFNNLEDTLRLLTCPMTAHQILYILVRNLCPISGNPSDGHCTVQKYVKPMKNT
jgi:hypothetical protein